MNLATLRVRETHGLRRFLYPLTAYVTLPDGTDLAALSLTLPNGEPVPLQATHKDTLPRLDFAVFLAPYEQLELTLSASGPQATVNDPIRFVEYEGYQSEQKRLVQQIGWDGTPRQVVYDGVSHLRTLRYNVALGLDITRNGHEVANQSAEAASKDSNNLLAAWATAHSIYPDGVQATTHCELTACKSWATVTHTVQQPKAGDVIMFTLPLTVTALPLLCDFGVGGGVYGKLGAGDTVTWETQFTAPPELGAGGASWTLATNGRTDYAGTVSNREEYHAQQWFHVLDKGKALAVAITHVPDNCRLLTVTLSSDGDVQIAFTLGQTTQPAAFGVCYHFLNDAPAIAAATNPQSILLPPIVDVL